MKTLKKINSITIVGRRWFQKSYGNTYFTADIIVNGDLVHTLPKEYGYGDTFKDVAMQWLIKNDYLSLDSNERTPAFWQLRDLLGISVYAQAVEVSREKDL